MVKSIKKRYKIFLFSGSAFLLMILFAFFSVRSNAIQTWVVANVVDRINNNTEANITFESLQITFFSKLIVTDLLLLDNNLDTLLYTKELKMNIKKIRRDKKIISLSRVTLHDPLFKIVSDTSKNTNLRQYLSLLPEKKNPADSVKITFSIDQIDLVNARFAMTTEEDISEDENARVDFNDLSVNNLNATIEDFMVKDGTLSMAVYRASFVEKSGLTIDRFASILTIRKGLISFRNIELSTPNSAILSDEISLEYDQPDAFRNFAEDVKIQLLFNRSTVSPTDISLFIPNLNIDPGIVSFSGTITGSFAQLRGRSILIEAGEITKIDCDFDLAGLPDFENTYIFVDVNSLKTRISEVANLGLISDDKIPQKMDREVGIMTFRGTFSGFSTDFVTYGKLITQAGSLSTDISFRPSGKDLFKYSGALSGTGINLGMIVSDTSHYGIANFNINVDGSLRSMNEFSAILKGEISEVSLNNYVYSNISLNGEFSEKRWNGTIKTMDENLDMEFVGMIDLQNKLPVFDFTLNVPNAKLFDLNIDKADSNSFVSLLIEANFTGNKVDNLDGEIRFLNSTIVRHGKKIEIINGLLKTFIENDKPAIDIKTDFINASIRGYYNFGSLPNSFETVLSGLFPSRFVRPVLSNPELPNKFELKVVLNNTQEVTDFFNTKLTVADGTTINMNYLVDNTVSLIASSDFIKFNTTEIKDIKLGAAISDSTSSVDIESSSFMLAGKSELEDFTVNLSSRQDTLDVNIQWDNNEILLNQGTVEMMAIFTNPDGINHLGVLVRPTDMFIKNRLWKINNSSIEISNRAISVNDLLVNTSEDFFKLSGVISERSEDTIMVELKGLDLGFLNEMGKKKPEGELRLDIEGTLSGKVLMTSALKDMMIETENFVIEDFRMISQNYGNIFIKSLWDNQMKIATISLFNDLDGLRAIDIIGSFNPEEKELQLTAKANRLPIEALNPILSSFAYGINGYATGEVRLKGKLKEPVLSGALYVDNGTIGIDYLKTLYFFNDSIRFNESGILFKSIQGRDEKGNKITINGLVKHKYFKNFGFDVTVSPVKAMALNTRTKDNDLFYGTAYATGLVTIKGSNGNVAIDVSASTDKNTDFFVPMNSTQTIGEYSFITFATDSSTTSDIVVAPVEQGGEDDGTFELNMELQVTPDAEAAASSRLQSRRCDERERLWHS